MSTARARWVELDRDSGLAKTCTPLTSCRPFIENTRGVLIHRPKYATIYRIGDGDRWAPHLAVTFLCGNGTTGTKNIVFLDEPPTNKLVCAVCEARAVMEGQPTSSEICGRHVHIGRVIAQQSCCQEK